MIEQDLKDYLQSTYKPKPNYHVSVSELDIMALKKLGTQGQVLDNLSFLHPFDNSINGKVKVIKVFQSKAKPVLLEAETTSLQKLMIFKLGDDLNLDLVGLRMLEIFNDIWKAHKVEFVWYQSDTQTPSAYVQNNVYSISKIENPTYKAGFIQCESGVSVQGLWDNNGIFNPTVLLHGKQYTENPWNFFEQTSQGYTTFCGLVASAVATFISGYVLQIRDRHQDNMMLRSDGPMFHIDFQKIFGEKTLIESSEFPIPWSLLECFSYHQQISQFLHLCHRAHQVLILYKSTIANCAANLSSSPGIANRARDCLNKTLVPMSFEAFQNKVTSYYGTSKKLFKDIVHLIEKYKR